MDNENNVLFFIDKNRNFITKNNYLAGKYLSIIGDSISTYSGYSPSGYAEYYPKGDLNSVNKTWWMQVCKATGLKLLKNASWSGSSVADKDDSPENSAEIAYSDARINDLADGDITPDIIIILIGTNDYNRGYPIGNLSITDDIPDGSVSIHDIKPAYACMLNKVINTYPYAHIYCCTLISRYKGSDKIYPILSNGISLAQINNAIMEVSNWLGANIIRLDNLFPLQVLDTFMYDGTLHPNAEGAKIIAQRITKTIMEGERQWLL